MIPKYAKVGRFFNHFIIIVLVCLGSLILLNFYSKKSIRKCDMKYGLCPAAACVPDPYDSSKAYCSCHVKTGTNYSVGNDNCDNIQPYHTASGEVIYSDYSPTIEKMGYHLESCPAEAVNYDCMNKKCSVDPNDEKKAICICEKSDNKGRSWLTFNKNGQPKTCNNQSGFFKGQHEITAEFINQNP